MKKLHALVLGASGATGRELLQLLLDDSNFNQVSIFVRTVPKISDKKLKIHKIDFSKLIEYKDLIKRYFIFCSRNHFKRRWKQKNNI